MRVPRPRGPISEALTQALQQPPHPLDLPGSSPETPSQDADVQVSLTLIHALDALGLDGVDPAWAEEPTLITLRAELEAPFEAELRRRASALFDELGIEVTNADDIQAGVKLVAEAEAGPSISTHLARRGTLRQFREFLAWKSLYQLKEADPHTNAIPRVDGRAKSALIEIQADEYGNGDPAALHSALFATTMREAELDPEPGFYADDLPPVVLAADNALMLLATKPRTRGAVLGHLAQLEMTSGIPMAAYARAARRFELAPKAVQYFDEHAFIDPAHEQVALLQMVTPFASDHPDEAPEVLFGAAVATLTDAAIASEAMAAWDSGRAFIDLDPADTPAGD